MAGKRQFRPSLIPSIVVVMMLMVLLSLGTWQMNRSSEKQRLLDSFNQAPELSALSFSQVGGQWEANRYRRVVLPGSYNEDRQLLMENQIRQGQPGYLVLTPFRLEQGSYVLVNRGWVARNMTQQDLPDIDIAEPVTDVEGLISHPPSVGMRMGSLSDSAASWPRAVPYVDLEWLSLQLAAPVLPWVVLLDPDAPNGFIREWLPSVRMTPEKHQGYAFQWYSLAVALIFLFVVGSLRPQGSQVEGEDLNSEKER